MLRKNLLFKVVTTLAFFGVVASAPAFAGEIQVGVDSRNQLAIFGSQSRDRLVVRETSRGDLLLVARTGSTINFEGVSSSRLRLPAAASFDRVIILMRGGNDLLVIRDVTAPDILIDTGFGNDRLILRGTNTLTSGNVSCGAGRDTISGGGILGRIDPPGFLNSGLIPRVSTCETIN